MIWKKKYSRHKKIIKSIFVNQFFSVKTRSKHFFPDKILISQKPSTWHLATIIHGFSVKKPIGNKIIKLSDYPL